MEKESLNRFFMVCLILVVSLTACNVENGGIFDSGGDVNNTDFIARESFSFEVGVENQAIVRLKAINGTVEVRGSTSANSVIVTGERRVGSESQQDALEHLEKLEVRVTDLAGEILVKTIQPEKNHGRNYVVDYTITMPSNLELSAGNVNGNMTISSIHNDVVAGNVNGNVDLTDIIGNTSAATVNGLLSSQVTMPVGGAITMTTVNGNIELAIPTATSADFSATVVNGAISVSNLDLQNRNESPRSLSGTLADGQGEIKLTTVNGNIATSGF